MMNNCTIRTVEQAYGLPGLNISSYRDNVLTRYKTPIRNDSDRTLPGDFYIHAAMK